MHFGPLKRFKIVNLYGYKDVEITFTANTLILIAGNGSGKTTILNSLYAFLRRRFTMLQSLNFQSIECEFTNSSEMLILNKEQLRERDGAFGERAAVILANSEVNENDLYEFLSNTYQPERGSEFYSAHPVVRTVYASSPFSYEDIDEHFSNLYQIANLATGELQELDEKVSTAMQGIEVVYLPTYRRIENPLLSPRGKLRGRAMQAMRRLPGKASDSFEHAHMNYGLEDVENRLNELSAEVERISNLEYRSASASIIDDALANSIAAQGAGISGLPHIEPLTRFLTRVSRADRLHSRENNYKESDNSKKRVQAISELYSTRRIEDPDQSVLRYFLTKIGLVIERTSETEAMLQKFVDACNGYLSGSSDEKSFLYEPNSMRVTVVNSFTHDVVPLSQLSSGEKQVVSILARLYLYNKRNFILIDEPELSLSLEWQRKIVPDMVNSGSVAQLLAITHSPFIFENELDPYAGAMKVTRHRGGAE